MTTEGLSLNIQRNVMIDILFRHPLPWRIDHDWTVEVYDAKGRIVIKLMTDAEANEFITFAKTIADEMTKSSAEIEAILADDG